MNLSVWLRYHWARAGAVVAAAAGVALLVAGWIGLSGSSLTTEQIPYLASGAVGGLFALGVAATLWLSADLRDEFAKLDEIYQWMQGRSEEEPAPTGVIPQVEAESELEYATAAPRRRPLRARRAAGTSEP